LPEPNSQKNNKIVIAIFIDFLATMDAITGGTERQILEILQNIDKKKFYPILFCLQEFTRMPQWENLSCEKYVIDVYSLFSLNSLKTFIKIIFFLRRRKVNIVHTFFFDSTLFGVLAARVADVPVVLSARRDLGFWYNKQIIWKLKFINRFTSRILVNSKAIKHSLHDIENYPLIQIDVLNNGIDLKRNSEISATSVTKIDKKISSKDRLIGIVANFNREVKRLDLFIKAAALVNAAKREVKFLIIGGGKLENDLRKLAKNLAVENEVIFCGPQNEVIPYLKNFSVGVLTSDSEGFSNVLLEYMACGIPAVATRVGGNVELIMDGKTGLLVPPGNPDKLAEAIINLLDNDLLRESIIKNARNEVRTKYDWKVKIKEIEAYYEQLINC
jgi:glycosyltransferase involved in cell wall biosynthesis